MTIPEITAYVMGLPVEDVRRLSATDVMGWAVKDGIDYVKNMTPDGHEFVMSVRLWRPDEDRNQSRMVTDKVSNTCDGKGALTFALKMVYGIRPNQPVIFDWFSITANQETRAALIAHMIHTQEQST